MIKGRGSNLWDSQIQDYSPTLPKNKYPYKEHQKFGYISCNLSKFSATRPIFLDKKKYQIGIMNNSDIRRNLARYLDSLKAVSHELLDISSFPHTPFGYLTLKERQ